MEEAAAANRPFQLVMLDSQMPELDGFTTAQAIRANESLAGCSIMMLTSSGQYGDVARCKELGLASYLVKPVRQCELLDRWERGEVMLAPPTSWTIALFREARDVGAAFDVARRQSLDPVEPCFVTTNGEMILTMPGDPLHPGPASAALDPATPTRFVLEGGRFVPRCA